MPRSRLAILAATLCATPASRALQPPPIHSEFPAARIDRLVGEMSVRDPRGKFLDAVDELVKIGPDARSALESALLSQDRFTHQLAAHVLRLICDEPPSERLLRVTFEGLASDDIPNDPRGVGRGASLIWNAWEGMLCLAGHAERTREMLISGLEASDAQQRFLSAVVLAAVGGREDSARVARVLITRLPSNRVPGDATVASQALSMMSSAIVPELLDARLAGDRQQEARICELIELFNEKSRAGSAGDDLPSDPEGRLSRIQLLWRRFDEPMPP